jgi:molybdopterin molybdotransferase
VRPRPTVAIITSGDEVRPLDQAGPGDVIDTNGPMIAALLTQAGCRVIRCPAVGDDAGQLERTLADVLAGPVDMLITTGGVSAGDRDLIPGVIAALGAQIHFHGVAMRPGKPVLFATLPDGRPIFALPGNPVAALVGARFFVMRALRIMAGCAVEAPISRGADSEDGVTRILKVRATGNHGVDILPGQQSHMLRPLLDADAWLVRGGGQPSALYPLDDRLDIA